MTGSEGVRDVSFRMTEKLLADFAAWTGDQNPLHRDAALARLSPYRGRVAHGMLSVSALLLMEPVGGPRAGMLRRVSGRFAYPVFLDDTVTVSLVPGEPGTDDTVRWLFAVRTTSLRDPVAGGEVVLAGTPAPRGSRGSAAASLPEKIDLRDLDLDELAPGCSDELRLSAGPGPLTGWLATLAIAAGCPAPAGSSGLAAAWDPVLRSSALVGMRLPGARATFLDFSFSVDQAPEPEAAYVLRGVVEHLSPAARVAVIRTELLPGEKGSPLMVGKLSVRVNETSRPLPGCAELFSLVRQRPLEGKVAIVTGASRGIGATTARMLAAHGARVVVNYLMRGDDAAAVAEDIRAHGGEAIAVGADVSDAGAVSALVAAAAENFGGVDILVNNASGDFLPVPFEALTWEMVQRDLDVNVRGAFLCAQAVVPQMKRRGGGRIINIVTVAADVPPPGQLRYVTAKSALVGLSRSLAVELAGRNILVNMVMPGMVETDLTKAVPPAVRERVRAGVPMGRLASTVDVAQAVVMLAGPMSGFTTGQKFFVTGGTAPYL